MSQQPGKVATIGGAVASVVAILLGRLVGWLFGLQVLLPLIAALVTMGLVQRRLPRARIFAGALGLQAADTTFWLLSMLLDWHFSLFSIFLFLCFVGIAVWLAIRPGLPPAVTLLALHAYGLLNVVRGFITMLSFGQPRLEFLIPEVITLALTVGVIVLLALALKRLKTDPIPA